MKIIRVILMICGGIFLAEILVAIAIVGFVYFSPSKTSIKNADVEWISDRVLLLHIDKHRGETIYFVEVVSGFHEKISRLAATKKRLVFEAMKSGNDSLMEHLTFFPDSCSAAVWGYNYLKADYVKGVAFVGIKGEDTIRCPIPRNILGY